MLCKTEDAVSFFFFALVVTEGVGMLYLSVQMRWGSGNAECDRFDKRFVLKR